MLSIAHAATGAFIAVKISNPLLAIPLILLSHYLEDAIAHWDAGTGLGKGDKSRAAAFWHEVIDLGLAALTVLFLFPLHTYNPFASPSILITPQVWGAFVALIPDFLEAPRNFLKLEPWWLKHINKFHGLFHHSIPRVLDGLSPQILLLVILYLTR